MTLGILLALYHCTMATHQHCGCGSSVVELGVRRSPEFESSYHKMKKTQRLGEHLFTHMDTQH